MCEEFNCLPSVAVREIQRDPEFITDLLAVRDFRRVLDAFDKAGDEDKVPDHPYVDLIWETEKELAEQLTAERQQAQLS